MGYYTEFRGSLRFTTKLTETQLSFIKQILREDCRDHPEWDAMNLTYIDLALLPDNSGIQWDGSEKTCNMPELVNVVITQMRREFPDFGLSGVISAQGSEVCDCWELYIFDYGFAKKRKLVVTDEIITCPHCFDSINLSHTDV
jgi:hypothetical protein